jgi:3-dehydroquinate dehydratase-2
MARRAPRKPVDRKPAQTKPAQTARKAPSRRGAGPASILVLSGPNLQLLGTREPEIYGKDTLADIHGRLAALASERGATVDCRQSNHEGELLDWLGAAPWEGFAGVLLNGGAFTHTSLALYDAIRAIGLPVVEVHLSNPEAREAYRKESKLAPACVGKVVGFGANSYLLALRGLLDRLDAQR